MHEDLKSRLQAFLDRTGDEVSGDGLGAFVDALLDPASSEEGAGGEALSVGIRALADYIDTARTEVIQLRPGRIQEDHIKAATDDLDAIRAHTEEATSEILGAAEIIIGLTPKMESQTARTVTEAATKIFESCNFQDITGQRITRIVQTLKDIESKVTLLAAAFGDAAGQATTPPAPGDAAGGDTSLLNGPQLPGQGHSQDEIDELLSSSD